MYTFSGGMWVTRCPPTSACDRIQTGCPADPAPFHPARGTRPASTLTLARRKAGFVAPAITFGGRALTQGACSLT